MKKIDFSRPATIFSCLAIVSMGLSISATHICIALSFLFFILNGLKSKPRSNTVTPNLKKSPPPLLLGIGVLYYAWFVVSMMGHCFLATDVWIYFQSALKSELSDLALFLFGCLVYTLHNQKINRKMILNSFYVLAIIIILTGTISAFSEFRLARLILGFGKVASAMNRPQHPSINLFSVQLYQPIGFMNTHLSYGGILSVAIIVLFYKLKLDFIQKKLEPTLYHGSMAGNIFLIALGMIVLLLNQSRSIIYGFIIIAPILLLLVTNKKIIFQLYMIIKKNKWFQYSLILCIGTFIATAFVLLHQKSDSLIKHTDYTRPIIWQSSYELMNQNPVFGTGPGNFKEATWAWRHQYLQTHPDLIYYFYNTPDGHAHNDLLHSGVIGGYISVILYLMIVYLVFAWIWKALVYKFRPDPVDPAQGIATWLALGPAILIIGGISQCYFQDDEVVVLFWSIAGWISSLENVSQDT